MPANSAIQLALENVLRDYIVAHAGLPADLKCVAAHASENLSEKDDGAPMLEGDYVVVQSSLPRGELAYCGNPECGVEISVLTDISDVATRETKTESHSDRSAAILDLFAFGNVDTVRNTLNAQSDDLGIGFTGWEYGESEDGTTDRKQLVAKLRYVFDVFLP